MLWQRTLVPTGCLVLGLLLTPVPALGDGNCGAAKTALDELHEWLASSTNGPGLHQFLRSGELAEQLELGAGADVNRVGEILSLYSSDTSGLDMSRFVQVREALRAWHLDLLSAVSNNDIRVIESAKAFDPTNLTAVAQAARAAFVPIPQGRVQTTKSELVAALARLDERLSHGSEENRVNWMKYLRRDELDNQLAAAEGPNVRALRPVLQSYFADYEGLELNEFIAVRRSLRNYLNAVVYTSRPDLKSDYEDQITSLTERLDDLTDEPNRDAIVAIGRNLGWLESGGFAGDLVRAVRERYWRSNLDARLSERFIAAANEQDVNETNSINDTIMGTYITGSAHLTGRLDVDLVPNEERASFDLRLTGQAYSNNVGYNGPVTIYSNGVTHVEAAKRIHLDVAGMTSEFARAWCTVNSNITCIAARSALVRKIAWRRAGSSKAQAEQIAGGRAATRVAGRLDDQTATSLADANKEMATQVRAPLVRRDAFPRSVQFHTSDQHLFITMLQVGTFQMAADTAPPTLVGDSDLAVRIHESAVANFAETLIGGETLTDEKVVELLEDTDMKVPDELQVTPESDPWSITFAAAQPVTAKFNEDEITVAIRGVRFTRGDQQVTRPIEISAKYKPDSTGERVVLKRLGDVQVEYINRPRLSAGQVAMKTFFQKKFEAVFESEIAVPDLTLPGNWNKAGDLGLQQLVSHSAWLTVGWIQRLHSAAPAVGG